MPPIDRELFEKALEALEDACGGRCNAENNPCWQRDVANALRERLAQPEQEPVCAHGVGKTKCDFCKQSEQCQYPDCKCATENPCLKGMAQPQRTHWDGCEEVHPECKKQEQEPFGYFQLDLRLDAWVQNRHSNKGVAFYTTPPRREWVGLTDEEVKALPQWFPSHETAAVLPLIRAIEAKLREKNNG